MGGSLGGLVTPCDGLPRLGQAQELQFRPHSADGRFVDVAFPPCSRSLGFPKSGRLFLSATQRAKARWVRLPTFLEANGVLEAGGDGRGGPVPEGPPGLDWSDLPQPGDLTQGWLGNCWLIASIASLAAFPAAVQRLFVEVDVARGRYVIQLFDMSKSQWQHIEIDDYIPCTHEDDYSDIPFRVGDDGIHVYKHEDLYNEHKQKKVPGKWIPLFGRPKGTKVWALLLEKAMAKFVGSYAYLAGGSEPYALMAFTGFPVVYNFVRPAKNAEETAARRGTWSWMGAEFIGRESTGQCYASVPGTPTLSTASLWSKFLEYGSRNYLMTASITKFAPPSDIGGYFREDGLVLGHAYSLICGRTATTCSGETLRLLMLRNPHGEVSTIAEGTFHSNWRGPWCDGSYCWDTHPEVASQVGYHPREGIFWMSWEEFCDTFDKICVLAKNMDADQAPHRPTQAARTDLCLSLAKMASSENSAPLRQLSFTFDPFTMLPEFLDDGRLETRLCWEATKPGRLQAYLDLNKASGNTGGYDWIASKIEELGLSRALGENGFLVTPEVALAKES